jgi:hypothetical protein
LPFDRLAPTYWASTPPLDGSSGALYLDLFERPGDFFQSSLFNYVRL